MGKPYDSYSPPNLIFRRFSQPLFVPVGLSPSSFTVPPDFFSNMAGPIGLMTTFRIVNTNNCCVRLVGTSALSDGSNPSSATLVTASTGWIFLPRSIELYGTQYPVFMSALAYDTNGIPVGSGPFDPLELSYGIGT